MASPPRMREPPRISLRRRGMGRPPPPGPLPRQTAPGEGEKDVAARRGRASSHAPSRSSPRDLPDPGEVNSGSCGAAGIAPAAECPSPRPPPARSWRRGGEKRARSSPPLPYGAGNGGCRKAVYGRGGRGVRAPRGPGGPVRCRCVRDARPQGRERGAGGQQQYRCPPAEWARRRWAQSYRALRRAQPDPERSGGARPGTEVTSEK